MALPTARLAPIAVGTTAYLGLAVLGWGGLRSFLSHPALLARIHAEEKLLNRQFGAEDDGYQARTSRLIPGPYQLSSG